MSFAPRSTARPRPPKPSQSPSGQPAAGSPVLLPAEPDAPSGSPYEEDVNWGRVGALSAGIVIGAVLGAGLALLYAPQSGRETRRNLARRARRAGGRAGDAWDDLGDWFADLAHRKGKGLRRSRTRAGWALEDLVDDWRRGRGGRRKKVVEIEEE